MGAAGRSRAGLDAPVSIQTLAKILSMRMRWFPLVEELDVSELAVEEELGFGVVKRERDRVAGSKSRESGGMSTLVFPSYYEWKVNKIHVRK